MTTPCLLAASLPRLLNWREREAERCSALGIVSPVVLADRPLAGYLDFLRRRNGESGDLGVDRAAPPELVSAYALRYRSAAAVRAAVEAWLLTGAGYQEVAGETGATPLCVVWYAALYCDVRGPAYSAAAVHALLAERREDATGQAHAAWLEAAYYGGASALRELLGDCDDRPLAKLTDAALERKKWSWAAALPRTLPRAAAIAAFRALRAEQITPEDASPHTEIEKNIAAMMQEINFTYEREPRTDAPLGQYETYAAELRADEMLQVGRGETLPHADALRAQRLPPPCSSEPAAGEITP
jgi:hypothetical protein